MTDLTSLSSHFSFGNNWLDYATRIDESRVLQASTDLARLTGPSLTGQRFMDIGSGSGLHALSALRLGAESVVAIDLDPASVAATKGTLARLAPGGPWTAAERSVFDLSPERDGYFDVVYSWGVLHHSGRMHDGLRLAAEVVAPGGRLVVALYRRTWCCRWWRLEKRWYASAPPLTQARARRLFIALFRLSARHGPGTFDQFVSRYSERRGMSFEHDVHDWLGGYPYESVTPHDLVDFFSGIGFRVELQPPSARRPIGLFGSGCDEFVFRRSTA